MHQRDFWDDVPAESTPYQRHSPTSRAAAETVEPRVATLRRAVLDALRAAGEAGLTDEEMQTRLGMGGNTQRPRRVELERGGLVRDSGRTRRTRGGREAVVWVAV